MADDWLDALVREHSGDAPAPVLTYADLKGFPEPVLSQEQNQKFIVLSAKIADLTRRLKSRRKADVAAREDTQARIDAAIAERNAAFGADQAK